MTSPNLVPCPGCGERRNLKNITPDPDGKGEIRIFHCPECDETMSYRFSGPGAAILLPNKA